MNSNTTELANRKQREIEHTERIHALTPAVDIYENNEEVLVFADIPGVKPDKINVRLEKDELILQARRSDCERAGEDPVEYRRNFIVQKTLDGSKIAAAFKQGVLEIHLPKREDLKPRRIDVRAT